MGNVTRDGGATVRGRVWDPISVGQKASLPYRKAERLTESILKYELVGEGSLAQPGHHKRDPIPSEKHFRFDAGGDRLGLCKRGRERCDNLYGRASDGQEGVSAVYEKLHYLYLPDKCRLMPVTTRHVPCLVPDHHLCLPRLPLWDDALAIRHQ